MHNVFHVLCLKKEVGKQVIVSSKIPPMDDEGKLILVLDKILQTKERRIRNKTIQEYLVLWKGLPSEDSTWENEQVLQHLEMHFLEDKKILGREDCNVPPKSPT